MGCTEAQKRSIERLDGPLLISAGAGSGKTFTLTRRIAWALTPGSAGSGKAFVQDIDEVLAITFTDKAAREIKARVRSTLRQEGLGEQALKVDSAWISTIHGMCSRILKEKALELGIDPSFRLVGDQEQKDLRASCVEEALGEENEILDDARCDGLFREYGARSSEGVAAMLDRMLDVSSGLVGGLDAFCFGPKAPEPIVLATELLDSYRLVEAILSATVASSRKPSDSLLGAQAGCMDAIEKLEIFVDGDRSHADLAGLIGELFVPDNRGVRDEARKEAVNSLRSVSERILGDCNAAISQKHADSLMSLARSVERSYQEKLARLGAFDMDGLLKATLRAFKENPDIAEEYASRFKLVMVDEFQDTNQLQIDMISCLAGEKDAHLCTVGDSQQSIYAFRGADVAVYEEHKERMRSPEVGALDVRLDANFRSNAAILDFAERVFSQDDVFGDGFLHLDAGRDESCVKTPYSGDAPRIDLVCVEGKKGVRSSDLVDFVGEEIARRFDSLRAAGHEPRDMVLLLGGMTHSARYAEILRSHGFDCVITGGSTFSSFDEVRTVSAILSSLADMNDSEALFSVLSSPVFALSADDFVDLSTKFDDAGRPKRRRLMEGFSSAMEEGGRSAAVSLAAETYSAAFAELGKSAPSEVVAHFVDRSGWLRRQEERGAVGMACAANILKALRFVEDFEADGMGMAQVARAFARFVSECGKEKPGALTPSEKNFVQIMTVHASKGLEFPIVALADCWAPRPETRGKLLAKHSRGKVWCSLDASKSAFTTGSSSKRFVLEESSRPLLDRIASEKSPHAYRLLLKELAQIDALAECRRRFYVAVTRASESLIAVFPATPRNCNQAIIEDVRSALCGDEPFPESDCLLDYGGENPARFSRVVVCEEDLDTKLSDDRGEDGALNAVFLEPRFSLAEFEGARVWRPLREGTCSYSSLSQRGEAKEEALVGLEGSDVVRQASVSPWAYEDELSWDEIFDSVASDSDKATDLGSAFHLCAQAAAEGRRGLGAIEPLSRERFESVCRLCAVGKEGEERLARALSAWFASPECERASSYASVGAEVPFMVEVGPGGASVMLEGEMDLLCDNGIGEGAYVVDYKTGGRADESDGELKSKHLLQAQCYALAVLRQGYPRVDLDFVRVEQRSTSGGLQVVSYKFDAEDLSSLEESVLSAYGSSN